MKSKRRSIQEQNIYVLEMLELETEKIFQRKNFQLSTEEVIWFELMSGKILAILESLTSREDFSRYAIRWMMIIARLIAKISDHCIPVSNQLQENFNKLCNPKSILEYRNS